jgi:ABC transporter fused permease/ATP-binding protein
MAVSGQQPSRRILLRRLLALVRPEAPRLATGILFQGLTGGVILLLPQGLRIIVDGLVEGRPEVINGIALAMIGVLVVHGAATALPYIMFHTAGEQIVKRLREQLYGSMLNQENAFFDENRSGELVSRISSDAGMVHTFATVHISQLFRSAISVIGALMALFYTSPGLTVRLLMVVPLVVLAITVFGRRIHGLSRQLQDSFARASDVALEGLSGIRTVRWFASEDVEVQRYSSRLAEVFSVVRRRILAHAAFGAVLQLCVFVSAILLFWYGSHQVISGKLSVGSLTSFLTYTLLLVTSFISMSELMAEIIKDMGAAERIFQMLDRVPAIPPRTGLRPDTIEGRLELKDVHFRYPMRPHAAVLHGLTMRLDPGEAVALVGPSGSGKSTVVALITRLYDPNQGQILLDGHDIRQLDPSWLRKQIGVVSQEPLLFSCSIEENIRYGRPGASDAEVEAAARAANAHDFITAFPQGYRTQVGERGTQLSGGQKQRIAIARAVLKDPRVLVLDEATSALDSESEHLVQEALDRLMRGRTTLIIAHRLSTVALASRVVVLSNGQVIQSGSHAALMAQDGVYRRLVERQFVAA